jgi:hypothetical protein
MESANGSGEDDFGELDAAFAIAISPDEGPNRIDALTLRFSLFA